jgi:hypothetical protein
MGHETTKLVLKEGDIDLGIVDVIKWLNSLDCYTLYSCQGDSSNMPEYRSLPYVAFICWERTSLDNIVHIIKAFNEKSDKSVSLSYCSSLIEPDAVAPKISLSLNCEETLSEFIKYLNGLSDSDVVPRYTFFEEEKELV